MYIIRKIYSKAMCFGSILWCCCICVCFPFLQDRVLLSWLILSGLTLQRTCWILCRTGPQSHPLLITGSVYTGCSRSLWSSGQESECRAGDWLLWVVPCLGTLFRADRCSRAS